MKIIHLSDLHLGKRVNEFPMLEDQWAVLLQILQIIGQENPDAVILAGDIYDKSVPPAEAVALFDEFLARLARPGLHVFVISGNHDSPERIAFGGRLMDRSGIHLSPVYDGEVEPVTLSDAFGEVRFFMLPFIKPIQVRSRFPEEKADTYTEALRVAVSRLPLSAEGRNVLITHQFVTGAVRSESEDVSVGGSDNVDASVFDAFDYVALGHLHGPQNVGSLRIRYCGTPLKYSFSEKDHVKSVTVAELGAKGELSVRTVPLTPRRDLREITGTFEQLTQKSFYEKMNREDYLRVVLKDEDDVPDAMARLRLIYPYIMKLDYDNRRTRALADVTGAEDVEHKTEIQLFAEFFEKQNGQPLSEEQLRFSEQLLEQLKEEAL